MLCSGRNDRKKPYLAVTVPRASPPSPSSPVPLYTGSHQSSTEPPKLPTTYPHSSYITRWGRYSDPHASMRHLLSSIILSCL